MSAANKRLGRTTPNDPLVAALDAEVRQHILVPNGQRIVVAVSGGLDSMVLLDLLHRLAPARSWSLIVAHYNHQLRGRSSDADERLVRRTAALLGHKIVVGSGDVRDYAARHGVSIEMAARKLRHEFFAAAATRNRASFIATAHHAGDQAELFFIRLLRGSGAGMAGMALDGPSPANPTIRIVRPLLFSDRVTLQRYSEARSIRYREDATNRSTKFLRNRIRHELLPLLKSYQPAVEETIARVMEIAREEKDCVQAAAIKWLASRRPPFARLHPACQRRCILLQLERMGIRPDFELVERLRNSPGKRVSVPGVSSDCLGLAPDGSVKAIQKPESLSGAEPVILSRSGAVSYDGLRISWKLLKGRSLPRVTSGMEHFDAAAVGHRIILRHWKPGDRFHPSGMPGPVKLQDLLTNAKIPRQERFKLVIAEDSSGRIFWVENLRISEVHKVGLETRTRLRWEWRRQGV